MNQGVEASRGAEASPHELIGHRSRKRIPPFDVLWPSSTAEALEMMKTSLTTACMAGGFDLVNRLKNGEPVERIIHLGRIPGFTEITASGGRISAGAGVTHQALYESPAMRELCPALANVFGSIANHRVRVKATIGGNLMAKVPAYDVEPAMLALGAKAVYADDARRLLVAVEFPSEQTTELLVDRSLRPAVSVYVGLDCNGGEIVAARAAVGCAYPKPVVRALRLPALSREMMRRNAAEIAARFAEELPEPLSDADGGAGYRRHMAGVLLRRLLSRLSLDR